MKRTPIRIAALALACAASISPSIRPGTGAEESAAVQTKPKKPSRLAGTVELTDGTPVSSARVLLVSMADRSVRVAGETGDDGSYEIEEVPHGYYEIVFETEAGRYIGNRILLIPPGKETEANFTLDRFQPGDARSGLTEDTPVPGVGGEAAGIARLEERLGPSGLKWFRTGKGVAVLLGGGTLIIAGLVALADNEEPVVSEILP